MSQNTSIEWADSTSNPMMGCEGCELRSATVNRCYAGTLVDRYGGHSKGYPERFEKPELFLHRVADIVKWKDLRGKDRPHKPWLNGLPRIVFLNDMGDTFTTGLEIDWMDLDAGRGSSVLVELALTPHIYLILTKRPSRMAHYFRNKILPRSFWLGTSITGKETLGRIDHLRKVPSCYLKFLSVEPLWNDVSEDIDLTGIDWVIIGGESGPNAKPFDIEWARALVRKCRERGIPVFVKQLGSKPLIPMPPGLSPQLKLNDKKGGDWSEWPEDLQIREMPKVEEHNV